MCPDAHGDPYDGDSDPYHSHSDSDDSYKPVQCGPANATPAFSPPEPSETVMPRHGPRVYPPILLNKDGERVSSQSPILRRFADWAFSAHGIPNLQVLVCGDFSHGSCQGGQYSLILCKDGADYHAMNQHTEGFWALVDANMDVLSACPDEAIMQNAPTDP